MPCTFWNYVSLQSEEYEYVKFQSVRRLVVWFLFLAACTDCVQWSQLRPAAVSQSDQIEGNWGVSHFRALQPWAYPSAHSTVLCALASYQKSKPLFVWLQFPNIPNKKNVRFMWSRPPPDMDSKGISRIPSDIIYGIFFDIYIWRSIYARSCLAEVSWYVRSCLYQAGWQAEGKGSSQKKRCSSEAIGFRSWGQESLNQEVHSEAYPRCATLSFERVVGQDGWRLCEPWGYQKILKAGRTDDAFLRAWLSPQGPTSWVCTLVFLCSVNWITDL